VFRELIQEQDPTFPTAGLNIDQIDRPALEAWLNKQKDEQKKKKQGRSIKADNNRLSKIIDMYKLYGSNDTALVKQRDNPSHLQVWNRDYAIKRQEKQLEQLRVKQDLSPRRLSPRN